LVTKAEETYDHLDKDGDLIQKLQAKITKLEEEIKHKEKTAAVLDVLFANTLSAIFILDRAYQFVRVNEVYARAWSREATYFTGRSFKFQPSDSFNEMLDQVVKTKKSCKLMARPFTYPDLTKWRETYWDWTIAPVLDAAGEVELLICTGHDVTEHVINHARLTESEECYRAIFEHSLDGIILSKPNGTILSANPAACSIFGCLEEELCTTGWPGLLDPDESRGLAADKEGETSITERTLVRKDGTKFTGEVAANCFQDRHGQVLTSTIVRDITKRKKTKEALRLSEDKFYKAFHQNQTMMAITRFEDGVYIDVNDTFAERYDENRQELIGKSTIEQGHWPNPQERQQVLNIVLTKGYIKNYETTFRKKSGEIGVILSTMNLLEIENEQYLLSAATDITEQKKTIADLRLAKELFYKTFNANPQLMAITIKNGMVIEINETFMKRYGYIREETIGFTAADINIWVDINERLKYIAEIEKKGFVENFETKYRTKAGEILIVLLSGVSIVWNNEQCILTIAHDITELRHYQKEVARLDSLHLIGEMSAGIGHEIRNPMTTVRGFLQLLGGKERYAQDKEYMDLMIEELDRANAIITEFLSLAKDKVVEKKGQSLNHWIRTIYPLLRAQAMKQDKGIEMELGDLPQIVIDHNEIKQLLLNLVNNGLDAMPPGGLLTVKTYLDKDEVVLAVQDQGPGIPPEVLEKMGTPFYTTKDHGTGLGLAICYSIAQRHDARLDIETGADGTTFYIRFNLT